MRIKNFFGSVTDSKSYAETKQLTLSLRDCLCNSTTRRRPISILILNQIKHAVLNRLEFDENQKFSS